MPIIKQAIKKVRADKRKTLINLRKKRAYKRAIVAFRKNPTKKALRLVYQALDKAAKTNVIHKNKAARIKSRLSKLLKPAKLASKTQTA